jgi:deoxyribonuclease-4
VTRHLERVQAAAAGVDAGDFFVSIAELDRLFGCCRRLDLFLLGGALTAAEQLGADAIVTHIGSHQGSGFAAGLERVRAALRAALAESEGSQVRLLLENTAGAGGTMGIDFRELGQIIDAAGGDPRLGICVDTAHIFESASTCARARASTRSFTNWTRAAAPTGSRCSTSTTPRRSASRDRREHRQETRRGRFRLLVNEPAFASLPGSSRCRGSAARFRKARPACAPSA